METTAYIKIQNPSELTLGTIVRRVGSGKDQQGVFVKMDTDGSLVVADVVDLSSGNYVAEGGKLRPGESDELFRAADNFKDSAKADSARKVIQGWSLIKEHPELEAEIMQFIENAYFPSQILEYKRNDDLKKVFVPVQEKFKIGKFKEKPDWNKVRDERFKALLDSLADGKHLTYVAFIPSGTSNEPLFFSIGTKPHLETIKNLEREAFYFKPTHGGHIKIVSAENEPKKFVIDAGSNEIGYGVKTSISTAEIVAEAFSEKYPDYEFVPLPGREAYGVQQSY